jgi:hypothetical protein
VPVTEREAYSAAAELFPDHDGGRFGLSGGEDIGWTVVLADQDGNPVGVVLVDADGTATVAEE